MIRIKKSFFILLVLTLGFWTASLFIQGSPTVLGSKVKAEENKENHAHQQYTCAMHPFVIKDEKGDCPICGMELTPIKDHTTATPPKKERTIKYWVAPMDPTYIRNEPGKSPMGMDLVPVYDDEAAGGGSIISIDAQTIQNMGVQTIAVERHNLAHQIKTVGLVDYQEPMQFSINTKISGWVEKLYINQTGQKVKKGDPLLNIYSPDLVAAQEEFLLALNNKNRLTDSPFPEIAAGANRLVEASRKRLTLWDISAEQIKALEEKHSVQKTLTLYATYSGIVTDKKVNEGMFIKAGMALFTISDISQVWINADIYEYELAWLKTGQNAEVTLPFTGNKVLKGTVTYIYPYVEAKTRTVKARLDFDNPGFELKPDMFVNVSINAKPRYNVLAIPSDAILHTGNSDTVFVALGDGKFEPRQVKTGLSGEKGFVEIVQGLLDNEKVVTSAQFMLDSESTLRAAIAKMLDASKSQSPSQTKSEQSNKTSSEVKEKSDAKSSAKDDDLESLF